MSNFEVTAVSADVPANTGKLTIIGSDNGSAPSHYLNQRRNIVNSNLRNKLLWNIKRNSYLFIQENAFENVVCEMAVIFSWPRYVNKRNDCILSILLCLYACLYWYHTRNQYHKVITMLWLNYSKCMCNAPVLQQRACRYKGSEKYQSFQLPIIMALGHLACWRFLALLLPCLIQIHYIPSC